ncbi:MAG: LysR family transcriptional regulator [Rickettsiales bacterium]|nr:LysR family transcriptional regulator [Rickettsiales bacterium]
MNIRDLEYICAVAKEGSFTKAAKKVFVSQPTLTMQIQKLEFEHSVQIFERQGKTFIITDVGKKILEKSEEILTKVKEIKEIAKNHHDPFSGELRIAAFPTLASYYFPKITNHFLKTFPSLKLLLVEDKTDKIIANLKSGEIDCAFLAIPVNDDEFECVELFEEEFLLAVNKNHDLAKLKGAVSNKDLADESLMLLEDGHCLRDQALEACSLLGNLKTRSDFAASSLETLIQMVEIGAGITMIPEIATRKSKHIQYLKLATRPTRKIGFYFRKSSSKKILLEQIKAAKFLRI